MADSADSRLTDAPADRPSSGSELVASIAKAADGRAKSKNLKPLSRLWPYLAAQSGDFLLMILFLCVSSVTTLGLTWVSKNLVDKGFGSHQAATLNFWFMVLGGVSGTLAFSTALRYFYITKLGERIVANLRKDVFAHILTLDPGYFIKIRTGEVISRLTSDLQIIDTLVSSAISIALRNVVTFTGGLVWMLVIAPKLTLLVLLIFPVVLVPLFTFGKRVGSLTTRTQDKFAAAVGHASETLDALETVQAFVREDTASSKFSQSVDEAYGLSIERMASRAIMTALVIALVGGGITMVLWLGAQDVLTHTMSTGDMVQFVFLAVFVAGSVANLNETWGDLQKAAGAMARIDELLSAKALIIAPEHPVALPEPARGEIRFDKVNFAYPSRPETAVLKDFSVTIKAGETVALVGPSGAGKSTVFKLLLSYYRPNSGKVFIDDVDIALADPKQVRARLSLVAQDAALFSGSPEDNIRFGREGASSDDIRLAAQEAQADGFIEALPEAYDQPLGERAKSLSGGQKQRLAIARALVRQAPILLLDEATSALDAENERLVQQALTNAMTGQTTLVIAHRLATVQKADRILVMEDGQIIEHGTHEQLVGKGGLYARLAVLQFNA